MFMVLRFGLVFILNVSLDALAVTMQCIFVFASQVQRLNLKSFECLCNCQNTVQLQLCFDGNKQLA